MSKALILPEKGLFIIFRVLFNPEANCFVLIQIFHPIQNVNPQFSTLLYNLDGVVTIYSRCMQHHTIYRIERSIQMKEMKNKKLSGAVLFVALIAVLAAVFFCFREKPVEGSKAITIEVVNKAGESKEYALKTDALYLRQAMEEAQAKGLTFEGTESEYGLTVNTVNGETADFTTSNAYWSFYVNDEYCNYGIDTQPVEDGDAFAIVYTVFQAE